MHIFCGLLLRKYCDCVVIFFTVWFEDSVFIMCFSNLSNLTNVWFPSDLVSSVSHLQAFVVLFMGSTSPLDAKDSVMVYGDNR